MEDQRIVTPKQLREGYLEKIGLIAYQRHFRLIRELADGNYLVEAPARGPRDRVAAERDDAVARAMNAARGGPGRAPRDVTD